MPNTAVDMNSWAVSACYPRSTFYPLSDGPSIQNHRITMTLLCTCSRRHARSQAGLCHCTNLLMSDQISQPSCSSVTLWEETAPVKLPTRHCPQPGSRVYVRTSAIKGWYFMVGSMQTGVHTSKPPTYPTHQGLSVQCQAIVKVHGVFPSCRGYTASSQRVQFH